MKKIFFLAATMIAAISMNATVYDLTTMTFTDADLTVTNGTKTADANYIKVNNTAGETVKMTVAQLPNMEFSYKNSAEKTAFKVYPSKIQLDGNQRDLTISGLTAGTQVTLTVCSKGDNGAQFADSEKGTAFTGCVAVNPQAAGIATALPGKTAEAGATYPIAVTATASSITIRETANGYVLLKVEIGGGTGLKEASAAAQVKKIVKDGKMFILKDGKEISVLGF